MKLFKLAAPRPIVLHNGDDAFEGTFQKPDELAEDATPEAQVEHARRTERHAAWTRYLDSYDLEQLSPYIRPGAKPAIFMVRPLSPDAMAEFMDMEGLGNGGRAQVARLLHACRYGVVEILNIEVVDELGGTRPLKSKQVEAPFGMALDPVSMELFSDPRAIAEVGAQVLAAGRLPKGLHKSG